MPRKKGNVFMTMDDYLQAVPYEDDMDAFIKK